MDNDYGTVYTCSSLGCSQWPDCSNCAVNPIYTENQNIKNGN